MSAAKRQLSFYAEADVDMYLAFIGTGRKTAVINDLVRSRMRTEAIVDLNDGQVPQPFAVLSDLHQSEVASNLALEELSLNDVDEEIFSVVTQTSSRNWKDNTTRYLALHQAKFKEPFRIKRIRSQEERAEHRQRTQPRTKYYCEYHAEPTAQELNNFHLGDLKCGECGADASYRDSK